MDKQCTEIDNIRPLNAEERNLLLIQDKQVMPQYKQEKLEVNARKNWDLFYKRNRTNFFKDRQWMTREFQELKQLAEKMDKLVFLEAGCGVGNTFFPLKQEIPKMFVHACDFSERAVQFIKENENFNTSWCHPFTCDLTHNNSLTSQVQISSVDIASLIFVLSAVHPDKFSDVLYNIYQTLRPGGMLIFRDYGINDWAMLRFKLGSKISNNFYKRQDGTRAYYFKKEELEGIMQKAGFSVKSLEYVLRETVNKKEQVSVPRVFLQGKFVKISKE